MFRKKTEPKNLKKLDRLIKGIIIGGAVGSVLGITLAPKTGKETRNTLKTTTNQVWKQGADLLKHKVQKKDGIDGFVGGMRALIFGRKKK